MYASSLANACGVTRLPAASPEPSSRANAVESIFTESVRNPRSTPSPASHEPALFSSRPRILSSISANQFWLELRIGKMMSGSGRPGKSASGEERPRGVQIRVGERHALHPGLPPERDRSLRPDAPAAPRPKEVVADRGGRLGRDRAGAVLERDQPEVRGPDDHRRRVEGGTGVDPEVYAVVMEAEPRHGRRVPPGEVPGVPPVVNHGGLEIGAVAHELSRDPSDPSGPDRVGDRV